MASKATDTVDHMEAKGLNNQASEQENELIEAKGRSLIFRMTEYAYRVLSLDMDNFFEKHLDVFDQDHEDFVNGRGETLEQYDVYQKYLAELEIQFDAFADQEGFSSAKEAFEFIQDAVTVDITKQKEQMKQLQKTIEAMQQGWDRTRETGAKQVNSPTIELGPRLAWMESETTPMQAEPKKTLTQTAKKNDDEDDEKGVDDYYQENKAEGKADPRDPTCSELEVGSEVEIHSLESRPKLNNKKGRIVSIVNRDTFGVVIYSEEKKKEHNVKKRNLTDTLAPLDKEMAHKLEKEAREVFAIDQDEAAEIAPVIMFCQPVPLESLVQQVLNLGEYRTFSIIMRMKVKERALSRMMDQKLHDLQVEARARLDQLEDVAVFEEEEPGGKGQLMILYKLYEALRLRLCELTSRTPSMNVETKQVLSDDNWELMIAGGGVNGVAKQKLMDIVNFVFEKRLMILTSPSEVPGIQSECRSTLDATWEKSFCQVMTMLLRFAHLRIDSIEKMTIELFQAHAKAVASAKQQVKDDLKKNLERAESK